MLTQQNPEMARVSPDPFPILVGVASGHEIETKAPSTNPDSNLDHNLHGRGGLSLDLNPVCLRVRKRNQSGSGSGSECPCKRGLRLRYRDFPGQMAGEN